MRSEERHGRVKINFQDIKFDQMLGKSIQKTCFSQAKASSFNVLAHFKTLQSAIRAPRRFWRELNRPDKAGYESSHKNLNYEVFDDSAAFWHAYYSQHPFFLQVFQSLENLPTVQFGTVDNPVVVFTADAPFRYVGCTGLQNEDDYEQHELMLFMLKEGPLQRCPCCGQVFKLVRLFQQDTPEMDFYKTSFNPIDMRDSARVNAMPIANLFKMNTHYEPNYMENILETSQIYDPVDIDLHQRILNDPAYRIWRFSNLDIKRKIYDQALYEVTQEVAKSKPQYKLPIPKRSYENLIEAEKAWNILDRHRSKIYRFIGRRYLDYENHDRREQRMKDRAAQRWENHYTYFYGGLTEEELKYEDYYQTDMELDKEDELFEQRLADFQIQTTKGLEHSNFDFQEFYTVAPEDDQSSLLEKKLFRFKYRYATDSLADVKVREQRMIERQYQRLNNDPHRKVIMDQLKNSFDLNATSLEQTVSKKQFLDLAAEEAFLTYRDYYEDDKAAELPLMEALFKANPTAFLPIYKNYCTRIHEHKGSVTIQKRQWDETNNLWSNYKLDALHYVNTIIPLANRLANRAIQQDILPQKDQLELEQGIKDAQIEAKKQLKAQIEEAKSSDNQSETKQTQSTEQATEKPKFKKIQKGKQ